MVEQKNHKLSLKSGTLAYSASKFKFFPQSHQILMLLKLQKGHKL